LVNFCYMQACIVSRNSTSTLPQRDAPSGGDVHPRRLVQLVAMTTPRVQIFIHVASTLPRHYISETRARAIVYPTLRNSYILYRLSAGASKTQPMQSKPPTLLIVFRVESIQDTSCQLELGTTRQSMLKVCISNTTTNKNCALDITRERTLR
jgi:hypothetical protein